MREPSTVISEASIISASINELAERLQTLALSQGLYVTTAESCTGGGIAEAINAAHKIAPGKP
ncbi:MAG: CinA family protein, partial [Cobetia crustatorum]